MICRRQVNQVLLSLLLCLLLVTTGNSLVFAQQNAGNINIKPNPQPIVLTLDATGHYTVKLSDVATVTGSNIAKVTLNPLLLDNSFIGKQTITVTAYANFNPLQASFNAPGAMAIDNK